MNKTEEKIITTSDINYFNIKNKLSSSNKLNERLMYSLMLTGVPIKFNNNMITDIDGFVRVKL